MTSKFVTLPTTVLAQLLDTVSGSLDFEPNDDDPTGPEWLATCIAVAYASWAFEDRPAAEAHYDRAKYVGGSTFATQVDAALERVPA